MSDATNHADAPLFHPFRIYPLHQILEKCALRIAPSASLRRDSASRLLKLDLEHLHSLEQIEKAARRGNNVADLAILLEPLYWPCITGRVRRVGGIDEKSHKERLNMYRQTALRLLESLDPNLWREIHESLRYCAASMDNNSELYLLLRLSTWYQRKRLKGSISGALWIRHLAEVVRRGFEEAHADQWPEEYITWDESDRRRYGSERPLDHVLQSKPYLAWNFGLFTGSAVRWYVEGETEYYAIIALLRKPFRLSVEPVNLGGKIKSEKDNAALTIEDWLKKDKELRRFSIISFDMDVRANEKAIQRQIQQDNVVGLIFPHKPDFEFANFAVDELAEVAARVSEADGDSDNATRIRSEDWTGISSCREFESRLCKISSRNLKKGEKWG